MTTNVPATSAELDTSMLAQLRELLPEAFPDGILDPGALLATLGVSDGRQSSFSFSWPGVGQARVDARASTTATLAPDLEASLNWEAASSVLIEGDNLQVLKILKRGYSGQAKLIYIDPPYNTGESFTYNDSFSIPESAYLSTTGQVDEQGNALSSKVETIGRKHAPWLNFMLPRLTIARHLLRRDGVILISIDNNEIHHLRLLMDAVFGAANFVDMITWQGGRKGDAKLTSGGQDYILAYARDVAYLKKLNTKWRERKSGLEEVYVREQALLAKHGDDFEAAKKELRSWFDSLPDGNPSKQHSHYDRIDAGGVWTSDNSSSPNYRANLVFDFKGYPPPENGWRYEFAKMESLDAQNKLIYPTGRATRIRIKKYLHEQEFWAPSSSFYRDRSAASSALDALMGGKSVFDNPKNVDVLSRLISATTCDDDLIIDFFAGSGTTGHATWEQNKLDGKNRKWVLVQAPEKPNESEPSGQAAVEAGYTTIFQITAERLRRASSTFEGKKNGIRVFRAKPTSLVIEPPIVAAAGMDGEGYVQAVLKHMQGAPVEHGADPLAVAWEVVLKATDTRLDAEVTHHKIGEVSVFEFSQLGKGANSGRLLVSLDAFTLATADSLSLSEKDTLILRGDVVSDSTTLTLAPRLQSKLVLLERIPREVSL